MNSIFNWNLTPITQLMDSLAQWMAQEKLTQANAATVLGVSRPRVSHVRLTP